MIFFFLLLIKNMERLSYDKFKLYFENSSIDPKYILILWKIYPEVITINDVKEIKCIIDNTKKYYYNKHIIKNKINKYLKDIDTRMVIKIDSVKSKYVITWRAITVEHKEKLRALGANYSFKEELWTIDQKLWPNLDSWPYTLYKEYNIILPTKKKTLDDLIKDIFNSEVNWLTNLPKEILREILLKQSLSNIEIFCLINTYMYNDVCNDYFWSRVYDKFYGTKALTMAVNKENIKLVKSILKYSKSIFIDKKDFIGNVWNHVLTRHDHNNVLMNIYKVLLISDKISYSEKVNSIIIYLKFIDIKYNNDNLYQIIDIYCDILTLSNEDKIMILKIYPIIYIIKKFNLNIEDLSIDDKNKLLAKTKDPILVDLLIKDPLVDINQKGKIFSNLLGYILFGYSKLEKNNSYNIIFNLLNDSRINPTVGNYTLFQILTSPLSSGLLKIKLLKAILKHQNIDLTY